MTGKKALAPGLTVEEEKRELDLSPFELKNKLITRAKHASTQDSTLPFLNAGRGNPNFFNPVARLALGKLTEFAIDLCPSVGAYSLSFFPSSSEGITQRFADYFRGDDSQEAVFLKDAVELAVHLYGLNSDALLGELTDAARGDFYPDPPRMLPNIETIVKKYLEQILINDPQNIDQPFDLFATEGATAGMVYAFKSLQENFIVNKGDRVAIITPVFSPYLEIPELNDFEFDTVYLDASEKEHWQVPDSELEKLKDPSVKALYLINPTNPTSVALSERTIEGIAKIVEGPNPNLVIIVDAVYATFIESPHSIIDRMPQNCITVYSFSKYFGVTGWRLGVIMLYRKNVIDDVLLEQLPADRKKILEKRYGLTTEDVASLSFIDRVVQDSRDVALAHTAGISCPQQAAMSLFALFNLMHQETYKPFIRKLLRTRIANLYGQLPGITYEDQPYDAHYYALIDILELAEENYDKGADFARYLVATYYPIDFVYYLAIERASVCLPGYGFFEVPSSRRDRAVTAEDRKNWSVRVSLANLETEQYVNIGRNVMYTLAQYFAAFEKATGN